MKRNGKMKLCNENVIISKKVKNGGSKDKEKQLSKESCFGSQFLQLESRKKEA